jgi:hypothetical protein
MDGWHFALYAFAVYLAVKTLVGLMRVHEKQYRRQIAPPPVSPRKPAAKAAGPG